MQRRTYLAAATGSLVGLAGCMTGENGTSNEDGSDEQQYPPYPDSESTDFSGEGETTTDVVEITQDGPTVFEVEHDGDEQFVAFMVEAESEEFVQGSPTIQAVGPYRGLSIHQLPTDSYRVEIEASGEWTATVHDLPVYEDGTGYSLPLERTGELGGVIGPIDFGEPSLKQVDIEFNEESEANWVDLVDREGGVAGSLFEGRATIGGEESAVEATEATEQVDVGGVGFLSVESGTEWTVSVSESD